MKKIVLITFLFISCVYSQNVGIGTPAPGARLEIYKSFASTNTVEEILRISRATSGAPASGIGAAVTFYLQTPSDPTLSEWGRINTQVNTYLSSDYASIGFNLRYSNTFVEPVRFWAARGIQVSTLRGVSWGWPSGGPSYNSIEIREPSQASIELFSIINQTQIIDAWASTLYLNSSLGTPSSFTPVQTGDYLGRIIFASNGYYGSSIEAVSTLDWSGLGTSNSTIGADLRFYTKHVVNSTGTPTLKMRITDEGEIQAFTDGAEGGQIKLFKHTNPPGPNPEYAYIDYIPVAPSVGGFRVIFGPNSNTKCSGAECEIFRVEGDGDLLAPRLNTGTGVSLVIDASGRILRSSSSKRFKTNIKNFNDDWKKILLLQPKEFDYKDTKQHSIGYIAEELHELGLNNLVEYDNEGKPLSIHYELITLYLLEIVKQQQKIIEELQAKIK